MAAPDVAEAADQVIAVTRRRMAGHPGPFSVALDGGTAAGKSTVAALVAAELGASVVATDDFFSSHVTGAQWDACSAAEKAVRAIDWRRQRREALEPLRRGQQASWHPFDFESYDYTTGSGLADEVVTRAPTRVIVVDDIYSCRPELADLIDLCVLVDASASVRRQRHDQREADDETAWHSRWDEAENYYFSHVRPPETFDLIVRTALGSSASGPQG